MMPIWSTEGPMNLNLRDMEVDAKLVPTERRFSPYDFNGGTTVVIAGSDFAIAAADTRMSTGLGILSRNQTKLFDLSSKTVLASAGCHSDIITLRRMLSARLTQYEHSSGKVMSSPAVAQLLSITLYHRRFFPYYAFCLVAGLDEEGKGAVYGYDAVGSFKRDTYGAMGSGQNYIMPVLDNLIGRQNRLDPSLPLSPDEAIAIVKDVFVAVSERDIYTGDSVEIRLIQKDGVTTEIFQLKKD
mmetsp:Transcript_40945/g.41818  ORF Transcript_40945/g.41818 Transcript_40945/m.41818 type:complete len:242 (+) Transcript_40945:100-825(+)